jgi:hypothetical protein
MNKKGVWLLIAGSCSVIGGAVYTVSTAREEHAVMLVGILTVLDIPRRQIQDERTRYLGAIAASYSWVITVCTISLLVLLIEFGGIGIDPQGVLGILLLEMLLTFKLCSWYFGRKGVMLDSDAHAYAD